ncbi:Serine/threonine-protein kinase HT1 [Hordeum vulgare]|nr:Serine/threonine-protein kinase HT1 [Hordeum vulgare]
MKAVERLHLDRSFDGDVKSCLADRCYAVSCLLDGCYVRQIFRSLHVRMDERRTVAPLGVVVASTNGRTDKGDTDLSPEDEDNGSMMMPASKTCASARNIAPSLLHQRVSLPDRRLPPSLACYPPPFQPLGPPAPPAAAALLPAQFNMRSGAVQPAGSRAPTDAV